MSRFQHMVTAAVVFAVFAASCGSSPATPDAATPGWMSTMADSDLLSSLSIPGTHESAANFEPLAGTAQCQKMTLAEQLEAGVRYFDIRCHDLDDAFVIYHGPVDEQQTFDQVIDTMSAFLAAHPTETVIMSIKEESAAEGATVPFETVFAGYVAKDPALWYLGDSVPALGDVRGKIVLLRRFDATTTPYGLDASAWADDTTFTLTDTDAILRVQDAYVVGSDSDKWTAVASLLAEAGSATAADDTLYLDYTSGYQTHGGLPNIPDVAITINEDLDAFFADPANLHAHLGVLAMDLVTPPRIATVAAFNVSDTP